MSLQAIKEAEKRVKNKLIAEKKKVVFTDADFNQMKPKRLSLKKEFPKKLKKSEKHIKLTRKETQKPNKVNQETAIVGCSKSLEKSYYRLKGEPKLDEIRNEETLKTALNFVLMKYKKNKDYAYLCDQLKGIRQDITVQRINNDFTVLVYKVHAKYSIQHKDVSEFNQCISVLMHLFKELQYPAEDESVLMFTSFQILYTAYVNSLFQFKAIVDTLPETVKANIGIQIAINVSIAYFNDDPYTFFIIYKRAPKLLKKVIYSIIERMQFKTIQMICLSYRPSISLKKLKDDLCFDSLSSLSQFITKHKLILDDTQTLLLTEPSLKVLVSRTSNEG
ncbi:hypothetical protein ENUP19_0037G0032 [Entamoeba nuttalli]|uniref:SAC3/GANP family protein n=2 Tax=Entamoeba nuttalli TaxID=412467 RepID=K2HGN5_ENTNP|nr:SAC3/GANP family protein [Entamoeba nuttalli P19]EKE42059.1 SAC3/GANP family protein [Entamoeba nuttalli P19]|eukprot:XP_008855604.1 SAC3/GANP family protein [Entamoeba nuttalli P19]